MIARAAFFLIALGLALFGLADKGLWLDEAVSLRFALQEPASWFQDHNMALFYALLSLLVKLLGDGERALRGLSVVSFALSAPLFHALLQRAFDARVAHIGCALFVLNGYLVHFAQEARGYMLAVLLTVAAAFALLRLIETRAMAWAANYAVLIGLALYAHAFAIWLLFTHALCALWYAWRERAALRSLALAFALASVFAAPLLLAALRAGIGQIGWIKPPTSASVVGLFVLFAGGNVLLAVLLIGLFLGFVFIALRALRSRGKAAFPQLLVASWFLLPVVSSLGISAAIEPIAHPKYLLICLPALLAGAAACVARLRAPALQLGVCAALVCLSSASLYDYYAHYERERWRELVAYLARSMHPGDGLVLDLSAPEAFDYYALHEGTAGRAALPPPLLPDRPWSITWPEVREHGAREQSARLGAAARIWLVQNRSEDLDLRARLTQTHASAALLTFEPRDGDDRSLFASSAGRIIRLESFVRAPSSR